MKVKVDCLTPDGQAEKGVDRMKVMLIGFGLTKCITEQKVVNTKEFFWILDLPEDKLEMLTKKCAEGEVIIRKFYQTLFHQMDRVKRLGFKFGKGMGWCHRALIKRLGKKFEHSTNYEEWLSDIESMTAEKFDDFMSVKNREEWDEFLKKDLITVTKI